MFVEFIMSTVQDRWKLIAHLFLLVCKRQSQWNKQNFGCSDWSTTDGDKVLTESWVMLFFACNQHLLGITVVFVLLGRLLSAAFTLHSEIFTFCLCLHFGLESPSEQLGKWFGAGQMTISLNYTTTVNHLGLDVLGQYFVCSKCSSKTTDWGKHTCASELLGFAKVESAQYRPILFCWITEGHWV